MKFKLNSIKTKLFLYLAISFVFHSNAQSVLVTIGEEPGQQSSTISGVSEFNFENFSNGNYSDVSWDGVGTFDNLMVHQGGTVFGALSTEPTPWGTFNSQQMTVGNIVNSSWGTPVTSTTLSLNDSSSYFGLYWAAGDGDDLLEFYSGDDLVAQYSTSDVKSSAALTLDYYGDPNHYQWGQKVNSIEPYSFLNFYGDENTTWDKIVMNQTSPLASGFEIDNLTTRVNPFDLSVDDLESLGTVISEVSGTEISDVDENSESWAWAVSGEDISEQAPGAPIPGVYALLIFAAAFMAKGRFS